MTVYPAIYCQKLFEVIHYEISLVDLQLYAAYNALIRNKTTEVHLNGDSHIQNFHMWSNIVGYTFGNYVLQLFWRVTINLNF